MRVGKVSVICLIIIGFSILMALGICKGPGVRDALVWSGKVQTALKSLETDRNLKEKFIGPEAAGFDELRDLLADKDSRELRGITSTQGYVFLCFKGLEGDEYKNMGRTSDVEKWLKEERMRRIFR